MCSLKGPFLFIILCITLNSREATPAERLLYLADDLSAGTPNEQEWSLPIVSRSTGFLGNNDAPLEEEAAKPNSHRLEKRRCNTATCVIHRLVDLVVKAKNVLGGNYTPTNVGSNSFGKRDIEPPIYLQL
ncbi:islet amyloid polypeptide [Varanus komodoensis]|uniref:Islet amyloid polypeptide n=1 Tax=Varanus komodoensis TaxID=61221 RepID=A0A8D2Q517_VARKO|nr:islet amyloid polypeptide [Varanus komodoensis]